MNEPPTEPTPNEHWLDMMMRGEGAPPEHARSLKFDTTLKLTRWEEGAAFCDWRLLQEHCSPMGFAFGGYVGCVVDQAAVFAMSSIEGGFHLTQDMRLTYFRSDVQARIQWENGVDVYAAITASFGPADYSGFTSIRMHPRQEVCNFVQKQLCTTLYWAHFGW